MAKPITDKTITDLLNAQEHEHLEFKEAKNSYDRDKTAQYCCALANENGGRFVLGITNKRPRQIVGTNAFQAEDLQKLKHFLVEHLRIRIEVEEYLLPEGRVLIFQVPSRPVGVPIAYQKTYWMRAGESLTGMTHDQLKQIFDETGPDFSQEICPQATLADLDPNAIERFRTLWIEKSKNQALKDLSQSQLLHDADLMNDGQLTYASLILLGSSKALTRYLGQAELIYEYRSNPESIPFQARHEFREGLLSYLDDVWKRIDARNEVHPLHVGLFVWQIPTFNERVVREAILNAVCHRDYRLPGSVFVKQAPKLLEVISPGGFMPGITPENILKRQSPRNRKLAEAIYKCGFVERSGQGADLMFEFCLKESKPLPNYQGTDDYEVHLTLDGHIQDKSFLKYLEVVRQELNYLPTLNDLLVMDKVKKEQPILDDLRPYLDRLVGNGLVERIGRGKGTKHILSKDYYSLIGEKGTYTRKKGLDRSHSKALLLQHIKENTQMGCPLEEFVHVIPHVSKEVIRKMLQELRKEQKIRQEGRGRGSRWFLN